MEEEDGTLDCSRPDKKASPPSPDPPFIILAILIDLPNVFFLFVTVLPNDVLDDVLGVGPVPKSGLLLPLSIPPPFNIPLPEDLAYDPFL